MYKIKKVNFKNHKVLGDLSLDFCNLNGDPVDTVIIAGENGTGKSNVLNALFSAVNFSSPSEMELVLNNQNEDVVLNFFKGKNEESKIMYLKDGRISTVQNSMTWPQTYPLHAIFSDIDISFMSKGIQTVTSLELDRVATNQKSTADLPTQIKQLIVDIQSLDDADTSASYRKAKEQGLNTIDSIEPGTRMQRFTNAFNMMFEKLTYSKVINQNNVKSIIFNKNNKDIDIDSLSSGEKQIVYRGCFLLKDINALNGAFVFIDEPEISLHPEWQKRILDYYKGIFTDVNGHQTSQIFVVTHSPFIIHNDARKKDKVIVLKRDFQGNIIVQDKPQYYQCDSVMAIKDAYNIDDFEANIDKSVVYLEGRTDEKYFKKALEVFNYNEVNFDFQWIGHMKNEKDEEFSGAENMNHALNFIKGRKPKVPQVFLFDSDTNREETDNDNIVVLRIPRYKDHKMMNRGIENTLEIDCIGSLNDFYIKHSKSGNYGTETITTEFQKMKFCEYICSLDIEAQKQILINLKPIIDRIIQRLS